LGRRSSSSNDHNHRAETIRDNSGKQSLCGIYNSSITRFSHPYPVLLSYSTPAPLCVLNMSYKRVKNVAGAPNEEDDAFDDDYEEEEEREFATHGICLQR
jgi:hypothetical protein